jgi:hypothetical protein
MESLRVLLAFVVKFNLLFKVADVVTAFLNGSMEGEPDTYVYQPQGIERSRDTVLLLRKALYGLKVAPRKFCEVLSTMLLEMGFTRCLYDRCVYVIADRRGMIVVNTWVDDLPAGCSSEGLWEWFVATLRTKLDIEDGGDCTSICGIAVTRREDGSILLSQPGYIEELVSKYGLSFELSNPVDLPVVRGGATDATKGPVLEGEELTKFRAGVGALRWLERATMPVITHAVNEVSRHNAKPYKSHMTALKKIVRFIMTMKDWHLVFRKSVDDLKELDSMLYWSVCRGEIVVGFADANLGDEKETKANSGYCVWVFGCPVAWATKKQPFTCDSTASAEYVALSVASKMLMWIRHLVLEMLSITHKTQYPQITNTKTDSIFIPNISNRYSSDTKQKGESQLQANLYGDNNASLTNVNDIHIFSKAQRHLARKYHLVRELVLSGELKVSRVSSKLNLADIFTKPVSKEIHTFIRNHFMVEERKFKM